MRELLRRLFGRQQSKIVRELLEDTDEFEWLLPPKSVADPTAWDEYWQNQLSHGVADFVHLFVDDGELVDAMRCSGFKTVLCVGNGISQEPRALAWAGFDVTSLDLSPLAMKAASEAAPPEDFLERLVGGRSGGLNGRLDFVVGNLANPACCPGPYDVVIDRKTLQLWPDADRPMAIQAVANRLASRGIFFSQSHDGGWKPPSSPLHALEPWFVTQGWDFWRPGTPVTEPVAWLFTTTG
jgi:hypothetical protein